MLRFVLISLLVLTAAWAGAQEPYLDDRSTPESLLRSLYNAINRAEYARAYSYFSPSPASDLESYAHGYQDTERVDLLVGTPLAEGAAGSVYYQLPIVIHAFMADGGEQVFAGCYTLRLANPAIQAADYRPMHIVGGSLSLVGDGPPSQPLETALPDDCGDGQELPPQDTDLAKASALFAATRPDVCDLTPFGANADDQVPQSYDLTYPSSDGGEEGAETTARLFRFLCWRGAYNEGHVYVLATDDGSVSLLHFAVPEFEVSYVDDDFGSEVASLTVTGFGTRVHLVNSIFDPDSQTVDEFAKWRGLGDAFNAAVWVFDQGRFRLVNYVVDASYDGESNPVVLLDYEALH